MKTKMLKICEYVDNIKCIIDVRNKAKVSNGDDVRMVKGSIAQSVSGCNFLDLRIH